MTLSGNDCVMNPQMAQMNADFGHNIRLYCDHLIHSMVTRISATKQMDLPFKYV